MKENIGTIKFNFFTFKFIPRKTYETSKSSNDVIRDVVNYISKLKFEGKGHLIDKHEKRDSSDSRELFMNTAVIMGKERRIRCSLALLRAGRIPLLKPLDKFKLVPIDKIGTIAEETRFYIDISQDTAIVCLEFNSFGPRISDIEYYFRSVAKDNLKIARSLTVEVHMDTNLNDALNSFKNVLNLDVKIKPNNFVRMDNDVVGQYFSQMNSFGNLFQPNYIKVEALFQVQGVSLGLQQDNKKANGLVKKILESFAKKPHNIELFENFIIRFENKEGEEEVLNLLKGKKEIVKELDWNKIIKNRQLYELIEPDFNEYIESL